MNISLQKYRIFPHVDTVISLDTFKDLKQKKTPFMGSFIKNSKQNRLS